MTNKVPNPSEVTSETDTSSINTNSTLNGEELEEESLCYSADTTQSDPATTRTSKIPTEISVPNNFVNKLGTPSNLERSKTI